jgi:hypothetical protein
MRKLKSLKANIEEISLLRDAVIAGYHFFFLTIVVNKFGATLLLISMGELVIHGTLVHLVGKEVSLELALEIEVKLVLVKVLAVVVRGAARAGLRLDQILTCD